MPTGGAIKKFTLKGLPFSVSSDADFGVDPGGVRITEKKDTTGAPIFIVDNVGGYIDGISVHLFGSDSSFQNMISIQKQCAKGIPVSCTIILADGTKLTPKGGAKLRTDDGKMMSREGTYAIILDAEAGEWIVKKP